MISLANEIMPDTIRARPSVESFRSVHFPFDLATTTARLPTEWKMSDLPPFTYTPMCAMDLEQFMDQALATDLDHHPTNPFTTDVEEVLMDTIVVPGDDGEDESVTLPLTTDAHVQPIAFSPVDPDVSFPGPMDLQLIMECLSGKNVATLDLSPSFTPLSPHTTGDECSPCRPPRMRRLGSPRGPPPQQIMTNEEKKERRRRQVREASRRRRLKRKREDVFLVDRTQEIKEHMEFMEVHGGKTFARWAMMSEQELEDEVNRVKAIKEAMALCRF